MAEDGLICRKALNVDAIQAIVLERYRRTLFYPGHCPTLYGHPGLRRIYNVLKRSCYWPDMASDILESGFKCESCRRPKPSQEHQRWLSLFPLSIELELAANFILGPLTKKTMAQV